MNPRFKIGLVGAIIVALACVCFAGETQERVAPPNDADVLHLSVVGIVNNADYQRVLSWFQNDADLASLRKGTHFHAVKAGSAIYDERYRPNIKGLPTVRLQNAKGVILYESAGAAIPKSPSELLNAIASKTGQVFDPPLLPWRRKIQNNCDNGQCGPQQEFTPEEIMEEEFSFGEPPLPFSEPEPEPAVPAWVIVVLALASALGGGVGAVIGSVKKEMG